MTSTTVQTPLGPFTIVGQGKAVLAAGFTDDVAAVTALIHPDLRPRRDTADDGGTDLGPATDAVRAYFDGDLRAIDAVEVHQHGGDFMEHAWQAMRAVEPGAPVTYTALAEAASRPAAVRAAAAACARNAAALFVPCHRIVRTDGGLGGYRWGLEAKRRLLAYEHVAAETR